MAKGKLSALEMFEQEIGPMQIITQERCIKLMRKFNKQETDWWMKMCDKWESAYKSLLEETEI